MRMRVSRDIVTNAGCLMERRVRLLQCSCESDRALPSLRVWSSMRESRIWVKASSDFITRMSIPVGGGGRENIFLGWYFRRRESTTTTLRTSTVRVRVVRDMAANMGGSTREQVLLKVLVWKEAWTLPPMFSECDRSESWLLVQAVAWEGEQVTFRADESGTEEAFLSRVWSSICEGVTISVPYGLSYKRKSDSELPSTFHYARETTAITIYWDLITSMSCAEGVRASDLRGWWVRDRGIIPPLGAIKDWVRHKNSKFK